MVRRIVGKGGGREDGGIGGGQRVGCGGEETMK